MKIIQNHKKMQEYLETEVLQHFSDKHLQFQFLSYAKGEFISTPNKPLTNLLFVVKGQLHIYGIREDGTFFSVNNEGTGCLLGDMEFCHKISNVFFTEVLETTYCIALPIEANRHILENDVVFLRFILQHVVDRLDYFSQIDLSPQSLESKLLLYLKEVQPNHEITNIHSLVSKLHCSRRQLQRVIQKLCEDGRLEKVGKGKYILLR